MDDEPRSSVQRSREVVRLLSPFQRGSLPDNSVLDWEVAWRFVSFHGVRPALLSALQQRNRSPSPPAWLTSELTNFGRMHAFRVLRITSEIVSLAKTLRASGLDVVFFKGAILAEQVLGAARQREFGDIDLLVRAPDREAAASLLEQCGYKPVIADKQLRRAFFDFAGQHMYCKSEGDVVVDLHWNFAAAGKFPVTPEAVLHNCVNLEMAGTQVPAPSTEDLALILAGHGQKEGWASFGWALDFAQFAARFPDFDWSRARERARAEGSLRPLLTASILIHRLFGHVIDERLLIEAGKRPVILEDVRRIVAGYYALTERTHEDDLIGALRLCENWHQRAEVALGLLSTPTVGDYERMRLHPRWWWIYHFTRPIRLIWFMVRGRVPDKSALWKDHRAELQAPN